MAGLQSTIDGLNELKTLLGEIEQKYSDIEKASQTTGNMPTGYLNEAKGAVRQARQVGNWEGVSPENFEASGGSAVLGPALQQLEMYDKKLRVIQESYAKLSQIKESLVIEPTTGLARLLLILKILILFLDNLLLELNFYLVWKQYKVKPKLLRSNLRT